MFKYAGVLITVRLLLGLKKKLYLPVCTGDLPEVSIFAGKRVLNFIQNKVPFRMVMEKYGIRRDIYLFLKEGFQFGELNGSKMTKN
jgi:hypothetical protein